MSTAHSRAGVFVCVLAAGSSLGQTIPQGYTLVELQPLGGGDGSVVSAINDRGVIVGRTQYDGESDAESESAAVATRWDLAGAASAIAVLSGDPATDAIAINNAGLMLIERPGDGLPSVRLPGGDVLALPTPANGGQVSVAPKLTSSGSVGGLRSAQGTGPFDRDSFAVVWSLAAGPSMQVAEAGPFATADPAIVGYEGGLLSDTDEQVFGAGSGIGSARFTLVDRRLGTTLDSFGLSDVAQLVDINGSGAFIGLRAGGPEGRSFVFPTDGSPATPIDPIGCNGFSPNDCYAKKNDPLYPAAINDAWLVVGASVVLVDDGTGFPLLTGTSAFVWSAEAGALDLHDLIVDGSGDGWDLLAGDDLAHAGGPVDISERGIIVGNGVNPGGEPAAYALIPRGPCAADTNRDGMVSPADFGAWILSFNNGCD